MIETRLRLRRSQWDELRQVAFEQETTVQEIIRQAVSSYLNGPGDSQDEEMLTVSEVMAVLGVTDRTLRKWAVLGKLTRIFDQDGRLGYRRSEIEELVEG